jgi:hypothetical protein
LNIDWVIPCRYVEVHDNLGTIVGAGIDTYWVGQLPTPIQVVLAVRLLAIAEELGPEHDHTGRNLVRDPEGKTISDIGGEFQLGTEAEVGAARTDWLNPTMLSAVIQFEATQAGTYTIEHVVDQSTAPVPIHIIHGPPPGIEPPA